MREFLGFAAGFVAVFVVVFALAGGLVYAIDGTSCRNTAALYGVDVDYGLFTGCNVVVDGHAVTTLDKWQTTHVTVDGE